MHNWLTLFVVLEIFVFVKKKKRQKFDFSMLVKQFTHWLSGMT
jgi:hypothetical protein